MPPQPLPGSGLYIVTFKGALAGENLNEITMTSSLTGSTAPLVTTLQDGYGAGTANNTVRTRQSSTAQRPALSTWSLTANPRPPLTPPHSPEKSLDDSAAAPGSVKTAMANLAGIGSGNVTVTSGSIGNYVVTFGADMAA